MNTTRNGKAAPRWKKYRVLGLVFLIAGVIISVVDRRTEALFLAGLGVVS